MANPIKETPVLKGKDAYEFLRPKTKETAVVRNRIKRNYQKIAKEAKG